MEMKTLENEKHEAEPEKFPGADVPNPDSGKGNPIFSRKKIFAILAAVIVVAAIVAAVELMPHAGTPAKIPITSGTPANITSIGIFWTWQLSGPTNGQVKPLGAGNYTISDNESQDIYVLISSIPLPSASAGYIPSSITNSSYHAYMALSQINVHLNSPQYVSVLFKSSGEMITIQSGSAYWTAATVNGTIGSHGSGGPYYITAWTTPMANGLYSQIVAYSACGVGTGITVGQTGFIVSGANTCNGDHIFG